MSFKERWLKCVSQKKSLLCVGLDPAEVGQRDNPELTNSECKLEWSLRIIKAVAPFACAIKPNRNYYKDFSRSDMQTLTTAIHANDMLAIDDSKIADIGATVDAGLFHAKQEGFDAVTFAAFAGNTLEAAQSAAKHQIALISLVLMSNPEFVSTKSAEFNGEAGYEFFAHEASQHVAVEGVVIGAPSPQNHITPDEVARIKSIIGDRLVLMPGIGAQGGEMDFMLKTFGRRLIVNVGRAIFQAQDPAVVAREYCEKLRLSLTTL